MDYNEIEDKYIEANIKGHYLFESAIKVKGYQDMILELLEDLRN